MKTGAIYHFTNGSEIRPIVNEKQIEALKQFATSKGIDIKKIYCDYTLKTSEQEAFMTFMKECEEYEYLVTKDFYHIRDKTTICMKVMKELRDKGITIVSMENGIFSFSEEPFDKPLRVVTYTQENGKIRDAEGSVNMQNDIFSLFAKRKTGWTIIQHYSDICFHQNDAEQLQLNELIKHKDEYDLVLVNNLGDIHKRTARLCKVREQIGKDIFSMQDGFLKYEKE